MLTVPDPTGQEPQGIFPHLESPLVRDLMLLLEYDASPECARKPLSPESSTPQPSGCSPGCSFILSRAHCAAARLQSACTPYPALQGSRQLISLSNVC